MSGTGIAAAVGATAVMLAAHGMGGAGGGGGVTPFGGSTAVHIANVGNIEIDLGTGTGTLARVRCVGAGPGTACYVAR